MGAPENTKDFWGHLHSTRKERSFSDKWNLISSVHNGIQWDSSKEPFQNYDMILSLRNELVHYKGEFGDGKRPPTNKLRGLLSKLNPNAQQKKNLSHWNFWVDDFLNSRHLASWIESVITEFDMKIEHMLTGNEFTEQQKAFYHLKQMSYQHINSIPLMPLILTDIEGTTSSISFVKDVLFPYARRALPAFVRAHGQTPEVRRWLDAVAVEQGGICSDDMIVEILQGMIDEDRKHTALKALQGMIWSDGYASADFTAHIYPDAAAQLRAWHAAGVPLAVYSSGSVPAQRLFFGHTDAGDLSPLFEAWFDTEVGHKRDAASYREIARRLDRAPQDILFLSDVVEELDAARDAGLRTVLIDRLADYPTPREGEAAHGHPRAETFDRISIDRIEAPHHDRANRL
jgi:enolase-phosphatase E1